MAGHGSPSGLVGLGALVALAAGAAPAYVDGPPPGHTGGFGEPTCHRCHFDAALNAPGGSLALEGRPARCEPARTYALAVKLRRDGMARAGFQLAARFAEGGSAGERAGSLRPADERAQVVHADSADLEYAQHTRAGARVDEPGSARWTVEWTAPESIPAPVVFHVAANAANDDDSEFGDHILAGRFEACRGAAP